MTNWAAAAFTVGFLHALAPDHWLPFALLAYSEGWNRRKRFSIVCLAGLVHVASAYLVGTVGLYAGVSLNRFLGWENFRAGLFLFLLTGFCFTYFLWAAKIRQKKLAGGILVALMALGPCEPLVPIMFFGALDRASAGTDLVLVFSAATIATMLVVTEMAVSGCTAVAALGRRR